MGSEPAPSLFGIDTGVYDSSHVSFLRDISTAYSLGARWDRFTAGPLTATGNWGPLDRAGAAVSSGARRVLWLQSSP